MLRPLLQRDRLHISEFRALADAQIAILMAEGEEDGAQSWLEMWSEMEQDHPGVLYWRAQLEGTEGLAQKLSYLARDFYGESDD